METRVDLVETQAEMRGCDLFEQISRCCPLNVIDVNKVKPSSLSSSSLGIKIIAVDDILQIMHLTLLLLSPVTSLQRIPNFPPPPPSQQSQPRAQQHQGDFALAEIALTFA
jgi:hypothetical protein